MPQQNDILSLGAACLLIDKQSFEALYQQYWDKVFGICYNNLRDTEAAKELVQDIFKSLWERRGDLQIDNAERYLIRAAKFKTFEYIRNKVSQQKHIDAKFQGHTTAVNSTEEQVLFNDLKQQVGSLVDTLPPQCKRVYQMSRERGMSNQEIASSLFISERAVEYHITRALSVLKLKLVGYAQ